MKQNALKSLIKQAVREAIQEELKDILLEAVRSPKQVVVENVQSPKVVEGPSMSSNEKRDAYKNIMGDMRAQLTSQNVPKPFNPQGGALHLLPHLTNSTRRRRRPSPFSLYDAIQKTELPPPLAVRGNIRRRR